MAPLDRGTSAVRGEPPSPHQDLIRASSIAHEVAAERGYFSALSKVELTGLGFAAYQARVPALMIPIRDVTGEIVTYLARPDDPRVKNGKPLKYEAPTGSRQVIDVPVRARRDLDTPDIPLVLTEGARKADAAISRGLCAISVNGVWGWRGRNDKGGTSVLPEFDSIALDGRQVYIAFDSDVASNPHVQKALAGLSEFLRRRRARVWLIYLPEGADGGKVGLDDYFAKGHDVEDLLALASAETRELALASAETREPISEQAPLEYFLTPQGVIWNKRGKEGVVPTWLTNFAARITADVVEDDGAEQRRFFEMETDLAGERSAFRVAAADYDSLAWVPERVGAGAIIAPGYPSREHARVAIQQLSGIPPRRTSYAHLGWREVDGAWIYLHAGGAMGADGPVGGAAVQVQDTLTFFELPTVPAGEALSRAVRASLETLEAAPPEVAFPVLAATYRAPLGPCSHGVHLTGQTGTGKSAFAALAQQHFGAAMDGEHLPASWTSTANYLEGFLFAAKDALVVVDDLTLGTSRRDVEAAQRLAERLYRAQGNQQGRGRMRADSTLRPTKYPRGLTMGTSEDLPAGQSLRARADRRIWAEHRGLVEALGAAGRRRGRSLRIGDGGLHPLACRRLWRPVAPA